MIAAISEATVIYTFLYMKPRNSTRVYKSSFFMNRDFNQIILSCTLLCFCFHAPGQSKVRFETINLFQNANSGTDSIYFWLMIAHNVSYNVLYSVLTFKLGGLKMLCAASSVPYNRMNFLASLFVSLFSWRNACLIQLRLEKTLL